MSKAMIWWMAIMAAANTAVAGTTLAGYLGDRTAGLLVLGVASLQAGTVAYQAASKGITNAVTKTTEEGQK